jgi:hypothetical protein
VGAATFAGAEIFGQAPGMQIHNKNLKLSLKIKIS